MHHQLLSWRLSKTLDADFCVAAQEEAMTHYGRTEIFNADEGSKLTNFIFASDLKDAGIRIFIDGKGAGWTT